VLITWGKKRKEKPKHYIDKEYPNWAWINYELQDANFFKDVK
jgi:hypothetical protein